MSLQLGHLAVVVGLSGLLGVFAPASQASALPGSAAGEVDCKVASTQAELNSCAYEDFLATQADMAGHLKRLQDAFSAEQRSGLRRVQRAWLGFRTETCAFESSAVGKGSSKPMVQWQCVARMTKERSTVLAQMLNCREGDLSCVRPPDAGARAP